MIEILALNAAQGELFKDFNDLFDCLIEIETSKLLQRRPDFKQMNWSFTIYPPQQVEALYTYNKAPVEAVKEAFEKKLPLIEICTGDYNKPLYIALTPNVDVGYFKKKWCIDYCTYHNFIVKENVERRAISSEITGEEV